MRIALLTNEYPPHVYGGAGVHVEYLARELARLEQHIVADSALNQYKLRRQIHHRLGAQAGEPLVSLNAWIYTDVFHTPSSDAWLGLLPRLDFTGLPGDGASKP